MNVSSQFIHTTCVCIQFENNAFQEHIQDAFASSLESPVAADIVSLRNFGQEEIKKNLDKGNVSKNGVDVVS